MVKGPEEIELLKEAVAITAKGFRRVLRFVKPGVTEFEVEAELSREFIRRRCKFAYTPIVASGKNNCVLHYLQNDQTCRKGHLLLLDVASTAAATAMTTATTNKTAADKVLATAKTSLTKATTDSALKKMTGSGGSSMPDSAA